MRITAVESFEVAIPTGSRGHSDMLVVNIHTDEGVTGVSYHSSKGRDLTKGMIDRIGPTLVGRDPLFIRGIRTALSGNYVLAQIPVMAQAVLDLALWDLHGKALGQPVWRILGPCRDRVPCYATVGVPELTDVELSEIVSSAVEKGLKGVKLFIGSGSTLERDLERIRLVREVVGPGFPIMVDCRQLFTFAEARRRGEAYQEYGIFWLEESLPAFDVAGYARLAESLSVPIATGEHLPFKSAFADIIARGGVHIAQPDLHFCGGLTEALEIAALCDAHNIQIAPHGTTAWPLTTSLLCTAPNVLLGEWSPTQGPHTMMLDPPHIKDGYLHPSGLPGLGIDFDEAALARHRVS